MAVELRLREKRAGQIHNLVRLPRFANLALKFLDARRLGLAPSHPAVTPGVTNASLRHKWHDQIVMSHRLY